MLDNAITDLFYVNSFFVNLNWRLFSAVNRISICFIPRRFLAVVGIDSIWQMTLCNSEVGFHEEQYFFLKKAENNVSLAVVRVR